jgi:hypothetical protein
MARPSAVEVSPYREEIEEMIKEGKKDTDISKWTKQKGAYISRQAINGYRNNKFNITEKARRKYQDKKSKERLENAADEQVSDIEKIDKDCNVIDTWLAEIDPSIMEDMDEKEIAKLFNQLLKTKDQKIKTKYQILGVIKDGSDVSVYVNNQIKPPKDPSLRSKARDLISQIRNTEKPE